MNKKKLALAIIGVALLSSSVTFAATYELPWTKNIYNVSDTDKNYNPSVSVFDDADNKCYVVRAETGSSLSQDSVAISCVKR